MQVGEHACSNKHTHRKHKSAKTHTHAHTHTSQIHRTSKATISTVDCSCPTPKMSGLSILLCCFRCVSDTHTHTHTHSLSLSLTHTHFTLSLSLSRTHT